MRSTKLLKNFGYNAEALYYKVFRNRKTRLYRLVRMNVNFLNVTVFHYEYVGSILYNIENPAYSAEDVRKSMESLFKIIERQKQIQKGQIV